MYSAASSEDVAVLGRRVFYDSGAGSLRSAPPGVDKLRSRERTAFIHLLVPFVSAYLLYLRRDQLPKTLVTDLPLAIVSLGLLPTHVA